MTPELLIASIFIPKKAISMGNYSGIGMAKSISFPSALRVNCTVMLYMGI